MRRRHAHIAPERSHGIGNPFVVSRDDDTRRTSCVRSTLIDVLDHRPPTEERQRFTGESTRLIACRDDDDTGVRGRT
jgi:hypothetical protein